MFVIGRICCCFSAHDFSFRAAAQLLLGSAEKKMAGPSNSKRKIMSWDKFQIIGGKNKCLLINVHKMNYEFIKHSTDKHFSLKLKRNIEAYRNLHQIWQCETGNKFYTIQTLTFVFNFNEKWLSGDFAFFT